MPDRKSILRIVRIALFVGLLILFRHLALLLVFFVAFERTLRASSGLLQKQFRFSPKASLATVTLTLLGLFAGGAALGVLRILKTYLTVRDELPEHIARLRSNPFFIELRDRIQGVEGVVEKIQHYAGGAVGYVSAVGHVLLYAMMGFILAFVFLLEHDEMTKLGRAIDPRSLHGTLLRWFQRVTDAIAVTLQFQLVVALFNALLTLPVLAIVGIPHVAAYGFMVFFSGLIPVVGNFAAGVVLTLLAYDSRGWVGVGLFTVLTFILHKVESYYLTPRLAQRHVRLPGFILILSLIAWEHLLGFAGLFVSFPFLYVASKIREEFVEEDSTEMSSLRS